MKRLALILLIITFVNGFYVPRFANALQEIDHPYFQTEEYKKTSEQLNFKRAEFQKLNLELNTIQEEQRQFAWESEGLLQILSFLPFFSFITLLLSLSLIFTMLYLFYLKKCNPGKWFILFKSHGNLELLFKRIKEHNKLLLLLFATLFLLPSTSLASTDLITDAKFYFFGNDVQKGYVYVKYPVKGRNLPYAKVMDIKVYPIFEEGSFEHQYNYLVHEFAIGFPPKPPEVLRVIDKCRTIENLQTTYSFISRLDSPTVKEVVQKRLDLFPKIRGDIKFIEIETIISEAKKANRLNLNGADIASTLNMMLPEVSGTSGYLLFAYLLVDVDPNKANELFERVKYKFSEIVGDQANEPRFKAVYLTLSKTKPQIFKPGDSLQLDDQNEPVLMVEVARFFDTFDERVASMIVKNFHLERTTKVNQESYEHLIDLWKKYRKEEAPALFEYYTDQFIKFSKGNLAIYMETASRIGYSRDEAIDALIKHDADYHGLKSDGSTLITKDFLNLMSDESLGKHFEYLKTRTAQAEIILVSLFQKRYDLFLNYLKYSYEKDPRTVSNLTFNNKLAGFSRWDGLVSGQSLRDYRVPSSHYLVEKELSESSPNPEQIKAFIQQDADDKLKSLLLTDNKLSDVGFLGELMLYYLYSKLSDPQFADVQTVLENSIGWQVKTRLGRQLSAVDSDVQKMRDKVQSARAELDNMKNARMSAQIKITVIWILVIITFLYIIASFFLSIRYSINAVSAYSGTRIGLFVAVFAETFAKFLTPILYFTFGALFVIAVVQLYGFLRSRDGEFPHVQRSLANYRDVC